MEAEEAAPPADTELENAMRKQRRRRSTVFLASDLLALAGLAALFLRVYTFQMFYFIVAEEDDEDYAVQYFRRYGAYLKQVKSSF